LLGVSGKNGFMAEEKKNWIASTQDYVGELRNEMRKVSWPNRKQVEGTTAVVIISVFAFAAYFAVVDSLLVKAIKGILDFFTK
jgi:preprotein translocase subunit SecE